MHLFTGQAAAPDNLGQIDRLRQAGAEAPVHLVTITLGGNDVGFANILGDCRVRQCLRHPEDNRADVDRVVKSLSDRVWPAIQEAAPEARVVVVGYPRLFSADLDERVRCGWLSDKEHKRANELVSYLDQALSDAAEAAEVEFVSVLNALDGHELCRTNSWVYPVRVRDCGPTANKATGGFCGHPLREGQVALAAAVMDELVGRGEEPMRESPRGDCPPLRSGHWTGTARSSAGSGGTITFEADLVLADGSISGMIAITNSEVTPGGPVSGTIECELLSFGTVGDLVTFEGDLATDGRSAKGSYDAPSAPDSGTWQAVWVSESVPQT